MNEMMKFAREHNVQFSWVMNKVEVLYNANLAYDIEEALNIISNILEENR